MKPLIITFSTNRARRDSNRCGLPDTISYSLPKFGNTIIGRVRYALGEVIIFSKGNNHEQKTKER